MMRIFILMWLVVFFSYTDPVFSDQVQPEDSTFSPEIKDDQQNEFKEYTAFLAEVFKKMQENYYKPLDVVNFKKFIYVFKEKIYKQMKSTRKTSKYIKWRSAAHLVDFLKDPDDRFSAFFPPKAAKDYEGEVLGKRIDLGIEGYLGDLGYVVSRVEPRVDAFKKGLTINDVIIRIDNVSVLSLTEADIRERLMPLENTKVSLSYLQQGKPKVKKMKVVSQEYFKQFSFMVPVDVSGVYCIQIQRFNRKTAEDITQFMSYILEQPGETNLILDLRGNPGGPPLAAREISAFFLKPQSNLAYFQKKNRPKAMLDVPVISEKFHYSGDIVILVDEKSGSASELFSGFMQDHGRAVIMGVNTAGQVLLKSMFHFDDESMVLLVTARGHFPDGRVYSYEGVEPDEVLREQESLDLIHYAAEYLVQNRK